MKRQKRMIYMAKKKVSFVGKQPKEREKAKPKAKDQIIISKVEEKLPKETVQPGIVADGQEAQKELIGVGEKAQIAPIPPKLCAAIVEIPYNIIADKRGDHWKLNESEKSTLGELMANWLNVVLPELLKQQPELFALCIGIVMTTAPKLSEDAKIRRAHRAVDQQPDQVVQTPTTLDTSSSA